MKIFILGIIFLTKGILYSNDIGNKAIELADQTENGKNIIEIIKNAAKFYNFISIHGSSIYGLPQIEWRVYYHLRTRKADDIKLIKDFIKDANGLEKEISYYILSTSPLIMGDPGLALNYYNIFEKEFPQSKFKELIYEEALLKLKKAADEFKEIQKKHIGEDERLWLLGNLFLEASEVGWNEQEVGYNMDYPFSLFERLIREYPDSSLADNAKFKMLQYCEGMLHEGGDIDFSLSCIENYKEFIKNYPKSELIPEAKLEIISHYLEMVEYYYSFAKDKEFCEIKDYLEKAKSICNDVINSFSNTQYEQRAKDKLLEIDEIINQWKIK